MNIKKLEVLMKKEGVTYYRLSKETGIPSSSFAQWKKGDCNAGLSNIKKLSNHFKVPLEYFVKE